MYWLSMKRRLIVQSMIMKYICQDLSVVRKDRSVNGRIGCGVCMYLRNNINNQIRDDLCVGQLECVVIEIIRPHSRPFFVSTWYI